MGTTESTARLIGPRDGKAVDLGSVGVRFMAWTEETGGTFSLVEHPIPPRTLVAALHRHSREDEYSFVLEGRMGALLGEEVVHADAGDFVHFFDEADALLNSPDFDPGALGELGARYGVEFDLESVPRLCAEYGLDNPMLHMEAPGS